MFLTPISLRSIISSSYVGIRSIQISSLSSSLCSNNNYTTVVINSATNARSSFLSSYDLYGRSNRGTERQISTKPHTLSYGISTHPLSAFSGSFQSTQKRFMASNVPIDVPLFFTATHEYIKMTSNPNVLKIGITTHAAGHLGEVVYTELPSVGTNLEKGGEVGTLESVKAVGEVYCPVPGTVKSINPLFESGNAEGLQALNSDPEGEGWLVELEVSNVVTKMLEDIYNGDTEKAKGEKMLRREAYDVLCEEDTEEH